MYPPDEIGAGAMAGAIPDISSAARIESVTGDVTSAPWGGAPVTANTGATTSFAIAPRLAARAGVASPAPLTARTSSE
ncbi:unannotated protein [freshwater metagenome]|uniref:Unannotated protein n=1 Tax=freshwater metagenome TaxID=449393 RepID=A0A6J7S3D2_9ZZZZ